MDKNPFSDFSFDSAQRWTDRLPVPTRNNQDEDLDYNVSAGESGRAKRFGVRTCSASQRKHDQSRIPGQGIAGRTGGNTREHFPRSSVEPSTPRPQMRSRPETRPALDEASWTRFYDIYKKDSPGFANKFSADHVKNALMKALKEKRVSLETVKGMGDIATLTEVQKKALEETITQCYLWKPENSSSKVSERLVTKYEQTRAATRVAGRDSSQSARPRQALNTAAKNDATPVRQANLQRTSAFTSTFALTADASKTKSTGSSSVSGAAGSFLQENQLLPETYSSRYVLESVIPAHGNPETMRKPRQQATQHITTDSSNSRLPPPPVRKQEASLISPDSLFTPLSPAPDIRPEFPINTHADTAVNPTLAANTRQHFPVPRQKAPEFAGARPKHPQYTSSPFVASARQRDARERDQAQDIQKLRRLLADIDISESTIHELVKRNYQNKNAHELYNTLHYELDLSSETSSQVVESVKPQRLEAWRDYRQKYDKERINKEAPGQSDEELQKQIERQVMFNARKISDPQVEILAVGSHMSDGSGSTFDVRRTAFADFGKNTDLSGDIHVTVNDIPEGKKFKEIHFTQLPGAVFDNKDASITLLKKVNKVMHKDGVLILSFGTGAKFNYDYKFLFENVLNPAGFADCIDIATDDFFGVQMLVFKNEGRNARLLPPQPAWIGGVAWPAPVSPARREAAPARSTGTLSQPVTQTILEPDSVHLGNATEEQVSKIVRNLKLLGSAIDEATCSGIKESINSIGLDEATIEHAAGDRWKQETKDALDRIQIQYTIQKLSPPSTPSVGAGLASGFEYTDRPADYTPGTVLKPITPAPAVVQKKRMGSPAAHNLAEVNTTASRQAPDKKDALMVARQKVDMKDQAKGAESSPIKTSSIVASAHVDSRAAKAAASKTPVIVSGNQPFQEIWSRKKDQLTYIMQSYNKSFDPELIEEALQNPLNPEFNLTADEFANLKVRYEEWRKNGQYTGLPFAHEIKDFSLRVKEEKQLFKVFFDDPSASSHMAMAAGTSTQTFSPATPPRTESVNFPERPFGANAGQIELSGGDAFNAYAWPRLPDRMPAQPGPVSRNLEMAGGNTTPSPRVRIPAQDFVRREENTATDDEVNDIIKALEKEYGRLDDEAISNIKKNIRVIKLSPVEIDNAAAGGRILLDKILVECQMLESSTPPRASSPKVGKSPVTSTGFGGLVQAEDVIDGAGTAVGPLQHTGLQSSFNQDLLRTASNDVEADGADNYEPVYVPAQFRPQAPYTGSQQLQQSRQAVGASELRQIELSTEVTPNGQPAAPLRGNRVIESMPLTPVFKDEIKLNYLIQHLKDYFKRNAQGILISRESLNRFLERHVGSISEKDFRAASAGAEDCVKDIARAYEKWQGNENAGSNRPVGLPALAPNPQAGLIPNDAGSVRRGYAPWNVGPFIMTPNIQTDGVVGLESTLSYEQTRVQTLTPQAQFHQNAFRRQLQALLNNQSPAGGGLLDTEGMTPSLMADLQGGNVENFAQMEEQAISELSTAQYPMTVHNDGRVVVQRAAGIQAEENNCAVAAVLMALSHQGNLGLLIEEGEQLINILNGQRHRLDLQLNQQLNRLIRLVEVLKEFNEVDPSVLRANDGLNEIRNIFGLTQGVILDSDEFLERIATMFRDLRPYANMRTNFDIFNLPGENMEEYSQMSIDEACRKFHLREVVREVGRENADSCALDAVCMTLDQSPSAKDAIQFVQTLSANPMFVNDLPEELQRSVGRINALLPLLDTLRERGEGHLKDFIPEIRRAYALEYTSIIYPSVLVEKIINDLNILVMLSSGQIRNPGEELIADCDNFYQRTLSSEVRRLNRTRSLKREPELVTNPGLFVVSTPSFGFQNRAKMEISPELTKTDSSGNIDRYRLDSVISITSGHYVAWMYDHQRKRLIAADSMSEKLGASAHEKVVVPAIVSMPMENTSNVLKDAAKAMDNNFDSPVKDAKSRFETLQSCFRLAFYRKV